MMGPRRANFGLAFHAAHCYAGVMITRACERRWGLLLLLTLAGCGGAGSAPELVWGKRGVQDGDLVKPRAIAVGPDDRIYLVDWTARIQAFKRDGTFDGLSFTTPDYRNGRPSGLSVVMEGKN